ncbi:Retrotransposon gag domain - like 10 [Theobroma cacao]|nr:Retrotransposon gag domain - like 10 [Theobroma cacao]
MPPQRGRPPLYRSVRRGRSRTRLSHPNPVEGESTAPTFPATPAAEPTEIPPPPPPPTATPDVPAMSPEAIQALAAFLNAQAGQAPSIVPPTVSSVPPPPRPVPPPVPNVSISKKLKETRQLGCTSFVGDLDATTTKDWITQVTETFVDMKLKVATRLLEKRARTWWSSIKSRSITSLIWTDFLQEFDGQYYTYFHQKEKKREFLSLQQGNLTIEEYKARFNELMSYVPNLVKSEQDQASYFDEGLRNEIRERMIVTGREPHKEVVQMSLRAEKLANENRRMRAEVAKRKNPNLPKRGKDTSTSESIASVSVISPRPPLLQSQQRPHRFSRSEITTFEKSSEGSDKCEKCGRYHVGVCWGIRCFHCGQPSHIRNDCPQLGLVIVAAPSPLAHTDMQRRDSSGVHPRQGVAVRSEMGSNTPAQPPLSPSTHSSTRVFAVTKDEARVRSGETLVISVGYLDEGTRENDSGEDQVSDLNHRGDAEVDAKPCGVSISIRGNEFLSRRRGDCYGPNRSSRS